MCYERDLALHVHIESSVIPSCDEVDPHFVAAVHLVLVTDILVLLTDRDQKYNIAQLQDLKVRTT